MSEEYCRPTHTFENGAYNATQVRLYGLQVPPLHIGASEIRDFLAGFKADASVFKGYQGLAMNLGTGGSIFIINEFSKVSTGIIYGYAFEGHCYDIPKPKIMFLPVMPEKIPADDCRFDLKDSAGYKVWVVDKLSECVEIEASRGQIDELVLEANLPGKRSPSTYRATAQVAHRSGRLME